MGTSRKHSLRGKTLETFERLTLVENPACISDEGGDEHPDGTRV